METNMTRERRYADLAVEVLELDVRRAHDRMVADEVGAKFMAVADAEIAQVQEEAEGWAESHAEAFDAWHDALARAEAAEATVARVKTLMETWAQDSEQVSAKSLCAAMLRFTLANERLHGPGCVDCDSGVTEFHRSRTDRPNGLRGRR